MKNAKCQSTFGVWAGMQLKVMAGISRARLIDEIEPVFLR
jgi:hypothetical protein